MGGWGRVGCDLLSRMKRWDPSLQWQVRMWSGRGSPSLGGRRGGALSKPEPVLLTQEIRERLVRCFCSVNAKPDDLSLNTPLTSTPVS